MVVGWGWGMSYLIVIESITSNYRACAREAKP